MIALVLQISPDEVSTAHELVNLITDLESGLRKDVEFILFTRKDVETGDSRRLLARIEQKFARARLLECWDFATGWPLGPNTMWCSLIRQLYHLSRSDELLADGALTFEVDCIPIVADWISLLSAAWTEARGRGKEALGHLHPNVSAATHLNGNAIFATDIWTKHVELTGCHGLQPWDVAFAPILLKVAQDTPLIDQWYRMGSFDIKDWKRIVKTPCALFHGVKVPEGRRIAREQLLEMPRNKSGSHSHQR